MNNEKCEAFLCTQSPGKNFSNSNIEACRICLATDTRLYRIQEHSLKTIYEQLTGLSMTPTDRLPEHLCWECAHRLVCCQNLRNKALRSYALMLYILTTAGRLTTTSMRRADRQSHNLCSTLTQTDTIYVTYGLQTYKVDKVDDDDDVCIIEDDIQEVHGISKEDISFQEVNDNYQNTDAYFQEAHGSVQKMKTENEFKFKKEETDSMNEDDDDFLMDENSTSFNDVDDGPKPKPLPLVKDVEVKIKKPENDESKAKVTRSNQGSILKNILCAGLNTKLLRTINLTFDEQIAAIKKRQESVHYKNLPYKCMDCYKGFRSEELYKNHRILHTDRMGPHVCNICKVHYKSAPKLKQHAKIHSTRISCKQCAFVTTSVSAAKYHVEYHKGTVYQCTKCDRKFTDGIVYKKHVRHWHPSFLCGLCGMSFISARGLDLHMHLKHRFHDQTISEDGPYCEKCEVRFTSQDAFDTHLKQYAIHKSKNNRRGPLTTKRRAKQGPPVACDQCDMQLPNYISYYYHFKRAHPGKNRTRFTRANSRFMCEVCGKLYLSMCSLQDHSTTHSESKQFECDHCHKTLRTKYGLYAHLRKHEKKLPTQTHPCDECGKRYSTLGSMLRHKMIHTGEKPYECDVCGKRFRQAIARQSHKAHVHLGEPRPKRDRRKRTRPTTSAAGLEDSVV